MLSSLDRQTLLTVARERISSTLTGTPPSFPPRRAELEVAGGAFVTLHALSGTVRRLRGCIGHIESTRPVYDTVNDAAYAAAFRDPRFSPLSGSELDGLEVHISILTPAEAMEFDSEADLLQQIRPGEDGLILEDGYARGTFLPSVWEQLPRVEDFWLHLKSKAGLPPDHWSDSLRVARYRTESFP